MYRNLHWGRIAMTEADFVRLVEMFAISIGIQRNVSKCFENEESISMMRATFGGAVLRTTLWSER